MGLRICERVGHQPVEGQIEESGIGYGKQKNRDINFVLLSAGHSPRGQEAKGESHLQGYIPEIVNERRNELH
jgi:hypothetical protein